MEQTPYKRNIAYKMRIGEIISGKPFLEGERLKHVEIGTKQVVRVNLIANIIDKYIQEGEKKFGSLTLDDGSGQIKAKSFGDDVDKFNEYNQGDTLVIIGLIRSWNNEVYITPEIMKKKDPLYLLVRKLEVEGEQSKSLSKDQLVALRDKIIDMVRIAEKEGGVEIEKLILDLHEPADVINAEVKRLIENGNAYEPRPGKLRWLG